MENIYKEMYGISKKLNLSGNPRVRIMLRLINSLNFCNKNILDIGCNDGTLLSLIANRDNNFYGIEASNYGVDECIKKGIMVKQFFIDGQNTLPFKNNMFDLIIASEIMEHIYDTDFFLAEIRRLLKKGGFFLVSTPNIASLGRRLMLLLGINPIIETSPHEQDSSGHIRYFTFKTLADLLNKHGFRICIAVSDVINFSSSGKIKLPFVPKIFTSFGQSIIYFCKIQ